MPPEARRISLDQVRTRCGALPPARRPAVVVEGSRAAAVLVPLFEAEGEARVVLTKRPETLPSHRGEIAFPGGKAEADESAVAAALREANEEIGLDPAEVEIVAELDGLATVASRFSITPFVGLLRAQPTLVPDPHEVDGVLQVPVSELLADGVFREERWDLWDSDHSVYFFDLPGETVWGATARILTSFLEHLVAPR